MTPLQAECGACRACARGRGPRGAADDDGSGDDDVSFDGVLGIANPPNRAAAAAHRRCQLRGAVLRCAAASTDEASPPPRALMPPQLAPSVAPGGTRVRTLSP